MRKLFALAMVAMLSLSVAFAVVGCGPKAEETPAATDTTTPPVETPMDGTMDTLATDTTAMAH